MDDQPKTRLICRRCAARMKLARPALARPQTPSDPAVSVHRLRACGHGRVARVRRRGALNELRDSLGAGANSRARTKDAPGQSLKATGRSGYSNSELMSGGASDACALANISACSRCLRVRIFPCQNSPRDHGVFSPVPWARWLCFCAGAALGQITLGDDEPEAIEPPENLQ
jgi:hypothetical protein